MKRVNSNDKYKIEEYLDAVRDIERGIQVAETKVAGESKEVADFNRPAGIPARYDEHARLIFDLMFLAYQTDMTRVVAFMMGHEGTNRNYLELGAQDGHHSLSHHKGNKPAIEMLKKVNLYQSKLLAYFLNKMKTTMEGDTSLLDNSIIIAGSALSDGNLHIHNDVPTLVLGAGQGRINGGRHVRYNSEPLSNLHLAVMDMFETPTDEFVSNDTSDATGILPGLV